MSPHNLSGGSLTVQAKFPYLSTKYPNVQELSAKLHPTIKYWEFPNALFGGIDCNSDCSHVNSQNPVQHNHSRHQKPVAHHLSHEAAPGAGGEFPGISEWLPIGQRSQSCKVGTAETCQQPTVTTRWDTRGGSVCFSCMQVLAAFSPLDWIWIAVSTAGHWGTENQPGKQNSECGPLLQGHSHRAAWDVRDLRRYNFLWEGREPCWDSLQPCPAATWKPLQGGLSHIPVVPAKACSYCKNCFFSDTKPLPLLPILLLLVFSTWLFVSRDVLCPLYLCAKYWNHVMNGVLQGEKAQLLQSSLTAKVLQPFYHLCPSFGPSPVCKSSRGEQSTAGRTIIQFQRKQNLHSVNVTLSITGIGQEMFGGSKKGNRKGIIKIKFNKSINNKIIKGNWNEKERGRKLSLMILFSQEFLTVEHCYSWHQRNRSNYFCSEDFISCADSVLHCSGSIQTQRLVCKSPGFPSFQKGLMTQCSVICFPQTKQEKLLHDWPAWKGPIL